MKSKPNRPLTHRLPKLGAAPSTPVTFTTRLSLTCSSVWQPTPQYVQVVRTVRSTSCGQILPRASFSVSAPVGQAWTHSPQKTQSESR